jgi:hypothetical protein
MCLKNEKYISTMVPNGTNAPEGDKEISAKHTMYVIKRTSFKYKQYYNAECHILTKSVTQLAP